MDVDDRPQGLSDNPCGAADERACHGFHTVTVHQYTWPIFLSFILLSHFSSIPHLRPSNRTIRSEPYPWFLTVSCLHVKVTFRYRHPPPPVRTSPRRLQFAVPSSSHLPVHTFRRVMHEDCVYPCGLVDCHTCLRECRSLGLEIVASETPSTSTVVVSTTTR
ncbi:hypothetical protein BJV74DRAFT_42243 [Russula compacta]|nr:hypothetical protein BJV74DRAFT_42243 [Russula compacta]